MSGNDRKIYTGLTTNSFKQRYYNHQQSMKHKEYETSTTLSVKLRDRDRSTETNDQISGCTVLLLIEKMNEINTKNYWKQKKRLCVRLLSGDKHHLRKSADRKAQISPMSGTNAFLICAFRSADFLRWCLFPERNLTQIGNLFFYFQ